ncbi:MAG: hypothetical protein JSV88_19815 [Candidatus Aminicenantes bacterium]|nr:MAG: hypothetical protein JSV88_19815 [Candidatus Aminicenantes bacterium]
MSIRKNENMKGITFVEILVTVAIISLVISMGMPAFNSHLKRMELKTTLRTVTGVMNTARYKSIMMNQGVKFCIEDKYEQEEEAGDEEVEEEKELVIRLKRKKGSYWKEFMEFDLEKNVTVSINSDPIFYPNGSVAPLCSIYVGNEVSQYKITISIAGRVKITEIKS